MLFPSKNGNPTGWLWNKQNTQGITIEQFNTIKDFLKLPFKDIEETKREVIGIGKAGLTAGTIANFSGEKEFELTKGNSEYEGWGTALKPAMELWTLARKPLSEKTVATNVLKWGTGGINIDGCRVEVDPISDASQIRTMNRSISFFDKPQKENDNPQVVSVNGRFPANVIHDGSDEVLDCFPNSSVTGVRQKPHTPSDGNGVTNFKMGNPLAEYTDSGSASRFFYCAKASKSERNKGTDILKLEKEIGHNRFDKCSICGGYILQNQDRPSACTCKAPQREHNSIKGNFHPTVKPVSLMRYLCRLITPKNGTVLDPYMGSGSTGIGAKVEGFNFIGIERESDYCKIAQARIDAWEEEAPPKSKFIEPTLF